MLKMLALVLVFLLIASAAIIGIFLVHHWALPLLVLTVYIVLRAARGRRGTLPHG